MAELKSADFRRGYALVPIHGICYDTAREIDETHVRKLIADYKVSGCKRFDSRNAVQVVVNGLENNEWHTLSRNANDAPVINPHGSVRMICIHGRHRLEAAKRHLPAVEGYWLAELYGPDLPERCWRRIQQHQACGKDFTDGDVFRFIVQARADHDEAMVSSLKAGMKPWASRELKNIENYENGKLLDKLTKLCQYPALLNDLTFGCFARILDMKCHEEVYSYLDNVEQTWKYILGDEVPGRMLDSETVRKLDVKYPRLLASDAREVQTMMEDNVIFGAVRDREARRKVSIRLQRCNRIVTLESFFADMLYLRAAYNALRTIFPHDPGRSFRHEMMHRYQSRDGFERCYQVIWLHAMRNFAALTDDTKLGVLICKKRKRRLEKPCNNDRERARTNLIQEARNSGFLLDQRVDDDETFTKAMPRRDYPHNNFELDRTAICEHARCNRPCESTINIVQAYLYPDLFESEGNNVRFCLALVKNIVDCFWPLEAVQHGSTRTNLELVERNDSVSESAMAGVNLQLASSHVQGPSNQADISTVDVAMKLRSPYLTLPTQSSIYSEEVAPTPYSLNEVIAGMDERSPTPTQTPWFGMRRDQTKREAQILSNFNLGTRGEPICIDLPENAEGHGDDDLVRARNSALVPWTPCGASGISPFTNDPSILHDSVDPISQDMICAGAPQDRISSQVSTALARGGDRMQLGSWHRPTTLLPDSVEQFGSNAYDPGTAMIATVSEMESFHPTQHVEYTGLGGPDEQTPHTTVPYSEEFHDARSHGVQHLDHPRTSMPIVPDTRKAGAEALYSLQEESGAPDEEASGYVRDYLGSVDLPNPHELPEILYQQDNSEVPPHFDGRKTLLPGGTEQLESVVRNSAAEGNTPNVTDDRMDISPPPVEPTSRANMSETPPEMPDTSERCAPPIPNVGKPKRPRNIRIKPSTGALSSFEPESKLITDVLHFLKTSAVLARKVLLASTVDLKKPERRHRRFERLWSWDRNDEKKRDFADTLLPFVARPKHHLQIVRAPQRWTYELQYTTETVSLEQCLRILFGEDEDGITFAVLNPAQARANKLKKMTQHYG